MAGRSTARGTRTGRARQERRDRRLRRGWAALGSALLALPLALVPAMPAAAASWGIQKQEISSGPYLPGQNVQWSITVSCSDPNADPCTPTTITDELPDGMVLVGASIQSQSGATNGTIDADTASNTVTYTADSVNNGGQVQILVTAQVDPDLPFSQDGVTITNTATVVSDNAPESSATDDIAPTVPLVLGSETTKTIEPEGALAAPGTPATITLGATNTSNDPVDTLVVQDPVDPTADPNPFTYLEYTGTGAVELPPDADTVEQEYWDGTQWLPLDDTVDPSAVQGVRYTFSGDIQPGATATIPVDVQQSDAVADLTDVTTITNDASSYVTHGDDESEPTTADDTYVVTPPNNSVEASKSFDPSTVSAGDPTTVTVAATNTGTPVGSMTITEPAPGTDSPFEGDSPLTFTGFGPDGDGTGVSWPTGATAATVTFTCADGTTPSSSTTTVNTLPNPPTDCVVVGFSVEFTGDIVTGGTATIPFTADTDPDQDVDDLTHPNTVQAEVPNAEDTASADLVTLVDRLATDTSKVISPSTIPAVPGQTVVVQLPTQLLPFGPDGSTTNADQVVIQDPTDPANPGDFWDSFSAIQVRSTDVPAGSTLTVNYWDGTAWVEAPGCGPYTGPDTVSCALPEDAQGVQFVYDSTSGGFPPGTQFQPNFVAEFTGSPDQDEPLTNCGASSALSGTVSPTDPAEGCATVDPFPVDDAGDLDFVAKTFLEGDPATVLARSGDQVTAQITWSTNGFSGVDPMVISDIADPGTTAIADSFYDAFDLVRVEPIDASLDPLLPYDAITGVELFVDGAWVAVANPPCTVAAPCDGSFPGYTLTADEREAATSVRLVYTESPSRTATPDDPTVPATGDGVARSTQSDGRHLNLTFEVRDERRGDGAPVLGSTNGTIYNVPGEPGLVNDTVRATGTFQGDEYTDTGDADVLILDQPLNVDVAKDWSGGPISVPPPGTPAQFYPSTIATVTGTNASNARIDQLRLADPGAPGSTEVQVAAGTQPFDVFTLTAIAITPPAGTETTTVTLTNTTGETATFTAEEAEALSAAVLAQVVGVEVAFDGLVEPGATGSMALTLQLRENDRYTGDPVYGDGGVIDVDANPVPNGAVATITDPGGISGEDERLAWAGDDMLLQTADIALAVGKSFDPGQVVEPSTGPVTMTLTGQPLGPSRTVEMVLTDDDPQFWNQYDFGGFGSATLTTPIQQVQVDVLTGGVFAVGADGVVVADAEWVLGTPSATFALPAGVAPEDVQGLRFTFTRTDGSIWENPANPVQEVPVLVERREDLRTGGPVLPDLETNDPAPGETFPGVASNTVDGVVTGADLVVDPETGDLVPVSATDDSDAEIVYVHADNAVEVVKDFRGTVSGGTESPASVFPMNITVRNTGDRPISDLVVTDPMPTDAGGPQLRLAEVAEPFSYDLSDAPGPATGDPLPTDPDDVTVDQVGDVESLTFSFPEGAVLEVGQEYTITVQVRFRVSLPAQTVVDNTAGVTGDRPWDECAPRLDEETGACEADSDVQSIPAAVLAQSKLVKATDDDELDVIVDPAAPNPDVECVPNADGFYRYPCTPVIAPGHDQTWHIRVDNVGNLPMDKVVIYDRYPAPGDLGSYPGNNPTPRGSQWEPVLTLDPPPRVVNAPAGATVEYYYTTVDDYCMDDIEDPMAEPVCSTDPATGWAPFTADMTEEDFAAITAIKNVIVFAEDALFQPGDYVALEASSTTPALVPDAGDRSIAWNSAAASGVVINGSTELNLLPTEGTKVGVATASGPLEVTKLVTGEGAENAPDEMQLFVQCTSAVGTRLETVMDPIPVTVTPGVPVVVPNLPYGAECTITEDGANGETALLVGTVTIDSEDPENPTTITAVNRYDLASIEITKDVVTDAVDQDGEPVPFGPFEVTVECTFLGQPVYAEGYGPGNPMVVAIEDGETVQLDGLPVGAVCTVEETGDGNASSVTITVQQGGEEPVTSDGPATELTLLADAAGESANEVVLTNTYDVGPLDLLKVVDGDGAETYGAGPFTLAVVCTFDDDGDGPGDPRVVYDGTVVLGGAGPLGAQVPDLPTGAECTVTETDDGGATSTTVAPSEVTVGAGEPVEVVVTNTFDVGAVEVDKVVDGDGAEAYGTGPFVVTLACTYQGEDVPIPGGAEREVVPGTTVVFDDLPVGAECVVTETDAGGATTTGMTVTAPGEDPVETDGSTAEVVVPPVDDEGTASVGVVATNTFDVGSLEVDKVVDGDGAALYGAGPFEVTLACTFQDEDVEIPGGAARELVPGTPVVYDGLPVGAECAVTETATGGATTTTVSAVGDGAPGTAVVPDGDPAALTVTNTFDLGEVRVVKSLSGADAAAHEGDVFTVALACTRDVDGETVEVTIPGGATRTLSAADDWVAVYADLPQGATCVVTETDAGDADRVEIVVDGESTFTDPDAADPASEEFALPVGDDVCHPVEVINTWGTSSGGTGGGTGTVVGRALTAALSADALAVAAGCADGPPADGGSLARTGATVLGAVLLALLLLGAGTALVVARRRTTA